MYPFNYLGANGNDDYIEVRRGSDGSWAFQVDSNTGNVKQVRTGNGVVKAAIFARCGTSVAIHHYFTLGIGVGVSAIGPGRCKLQSGFRVNDRFYTATAHGTDALNARIVNCTWTGDQNELKCRRSNTNNVGVDGDIMVVIY